MIHVVAGSYSEFLDYCREKGLAPRRDALYVERAITLRGLVPGPNTELRTVGSWHNRLDHEDWEGAVRNFRTLEELARRGIEQTRARGGAT